MRKLLALLLLPILLIGMSGRVQADVNDFVINDFKADYYLSRNDNQGSLEIHEELTVTFSDLNHGILRALPQSYKGQSLNIEVISVDYRNEDGGGGGFSTYTDNGNLVLKIGEPDAVVTGQQHYSIKYKVDNVVSTR